MTSVENLKCIFCSAEFNDKELLQEHFRKHGDPEFNKTKLQNEVPTSTEKSDESELVGCDVCEELFQTISKAITHKHKMHPDHDAKYFCPWCGKLFTMKHLYNKHIKTSHNGQTNCDVKDFHCDKCSVYFFVPSAMLHHNKFFHRQDSDMNTLGSSKKVRLCNQELVSILYCPFCGEEYNNKVNLDKHMQDDHADENQSPEDILRCPLCEAILYHLDAYELHLTFHSTDDVYSEPNEMVAEITEFSLEAVPPLMEKVEDANNSGDNLLQMFMDDSGEPSKVKSKKHKKHKKSKKETITLDEFLNMNKDVFGDGLNVQGIEEVPTQMVLKKKYKTKRPEINITKTVKQDLSKLEKQGIVIKSNPNKLVSNISTMNKKDSINQNVTTNARAQTSIDANEMIYKLMGQGNSQIKIVKTSVKQDSDNISDSYQSSKVDSSSDYNNKIILTENNQKDSADNNNDKNGTEEHLQEPIRPVNQAVDEKEQNLKIIDYNSDTLNNPVIDEGNVSLQKTSECNLPVKAFQNIGPGITIKSLSQVSCENKATGITQEQVEYNEEETLEDNTEDGKKDEEPKDSDSSINKNTLQSLNLNKGITIKSVVKHSTSKENATLHKPLSTLLSKQITVKPSDISPSSNNDNMTDEEENKEYNTADDEYYSDSDSQVSKKSEMPPNQESVVQSNADILKRLTNVTAKPVLPKSGATNTSSKPGNSTCKTPKHVIKRTMENDVEILHIDDSDSDADIERPMLQKPNLTNVTSKVTNQNMKIPPSKASGGLNKNVTVKSMSQQSTKYTKVMSKDGQNESKKTSTSRTFESKSINVTNSSNKATEDQNLQKTLNSLKHVTIKPKNSFNSNFKQEPDEEDEDHDYSSDQPLEDEEYDSDASTGKVQISEVNDEEASQSEHENENGDESNAKVESPPQSPHNSDKNDEGDSADFDIESQIKATPIKKIKQPEQSLQQPTTSNYPNLSKEITIKPAKKIKDLDHDVPPQGVDDATKNAQTKSKPVSQRQQINRNAVQSQKTTSSNEMNTVKTVKTYQSQTVIEEVTTTVTKTIRTVNTHEVNNANQIVYKTRPQIVHRPRNPNQTSFVGAKVKNYGPEVRPVVNHSNLISTRPRVANAQSSISSNVRKPAPIALNRPRAPTSIRPPRAVLPATKRAADDVGHFSCFKKSKESLFPAEVTSTKDDDTIQYSSMKSKSTLNVTQVQIGDTQMRSETSSSSQQSISKLSGVSGLKIVKTNCKQARHVEEKCEMPAKSSTMAALEKLKKQGLLIKKPRLELEGEAHSHSENEENEDGGE